MSVRLITSLINGCKNRIGLYPKLFRANSVWAPRIAKNITPCEKHIFENYILTKNKVRNDVADVIVNNKAAMRMYCATGQVAGNQSAMQILDNLDDFIRFLT